MSLPVEIYLKILSEVFDSQETIRPVSYHIDRPLHQAARAQRLAWFRSIAGVSKTWVDLARTAFWTEVTLFTVYELVAFARAVEDPSAKPARIRRLYFRFPDYYHQKYSPPDAEMVAKEALRCFPIALRRLPAHLDVLDVGCLINHHVQSDVLYYILLATCQDSAWTIGVTTLVIGSGGGIGDMFKYFEFARNIRHLVLAVTDRDVFDVFKPSNLSMQLESLVLSMQTSYATASSHLLPDAVGAATQVLRPACSNLQSLTIKLYQYDRITRNIRIKAARHALSLMGPSTSVLALYATPASETINLANECCNAFPPCPALRHLNLDAFGVSSYAFRQMGCFELRKLEVTVTERPDASFRDGAETMWDILDSIKLNELASLENLVVNFGSGEIFDEYEPPRSTLGPWIGTKATWEPLEAACASRNIACLIRHPE